jgi:hypothetical protein
MLFNSNRTAQLLWPLAMSGHVISNLGDATAADHALNRGAADARYLRAPSALYQPNAVTTGAPGAWVNLWSGNYTVARAPARILVSVALNVDMVTPTTSILGVRCQTGIGIYTQRENFVFKPSAGGLSAGGISTQFFVDFAGPGTIQPLGIDIALLDGTTAVTTIAAGDDRSQICIVDLGPP